MSLYRPDRPEAVLQPKDLGQILDQTFRTFGRYWRPLVAVGLLVGLPGLILALLQISLMPGLMADPTDHPLVLAATAAEMGDFTPLFSVLGVFFGMSVGGLLLYPLFQGALIDVAARAVLHMEPVPLGETFRVAAGRYWPMLGVFALLILVWIVALPVLILAGLVVLAPITVLVGYVALLVLSIFSTHAVVVEQLGPIAAIRRSFKLAWSRFWPLLGTGIVFSLMTGVLSMIIIGPVSFAAAITTALTASFIPTAVSSLLQWAVTSIIVPFTMVGLTLIYFDTRVRREGYDLELMVAAQAAASAPADYQP